MPIVGASGMPVIVQASAQPFGGDVPCGVLIDPKMGRREGVSDPRDADARSVGY